MPSIENRRDRLLLKCAQFAPPERVHDVVLERGMQPVECRHRRNSISSTVATARSWSLNSASATVRA